MRKILQRNVLFAFLSLAMLSIVFLGCVHDSDDDDEVKTKTYTGDPTASSGTVKVGNEMFTITNSTTMTIDSDTYKRVQ